MIDKKLLNHCKVLDNEENVWYTGKNLVLDRHTQVSLLKPITQCNGIQSS